MGDDTDITDEVREKLQDSDDVSTDSDGDNSSEPIFVTDENEGEGDE